MMLMKVLISDSHVCVDVVGTWIGNAVPAHTLAFVGSYQLVHYSECSDNCRIAIGQQGEGDVVLGSKLSKNFYGVITDCKN